MYTVTFSAREATYWRHDGYTQPSELEERGRSVERVLRRGKHLVIDNDCLGIREAVMLFYIPHIRLAMPAFENGNVKAKIGIPLKMRVVFLKVVN